jgi:hypothetical protein
MVVDNPNILVLARKLEQVPDVIQVRFWTPLLPGGIRAVGPGGMNFMCVTRDFSNPEEKIHMFQSLIPASVINNEEHHQAVIDNTTSLVEHYFQTGEFPHGTKWSDKALFHTENINDFVQNPPEEPPLNP